MKNDPSKGKSLEKRNSLKKSGKKKSKEERKTDELPECFNLKKQKRKKPGKIEPIYDRSGNSENSLP